MLNIRMAIELNGNNVHFLSIVNVFFLFYLFCENILIYFLNAEPLATKFAWTSTWLHVLCFNISLNLFCNNVALCWMLAASRPCTDPEKPEEMVKEKIKTVQHKTKTIFLFSFIFVQIFHSGPVSATAAAAGPLATAPTEMKT